VENAGVIAFIAIDPGTSQRPQGLVVKSFQNTWASDACDQHHDA